MVLQQFCPSWQVVSTSGVARGWEEVGARAGPGTEARPAGQKPAPGGWAVHSPPCLPTMALPLPWFSRCCSRRLLPSWPLAPQGSRMCCSQSPKASADEPSSSTGSGKMRAPTKVSNTKSGAGGHEGRFVLGSRGIPSHPAPDLTADTNPERWSLLPTPNPQLPRTLPPPPHSRPGPPPPPRTPPFL